MTFPCGRKRLTCPFVFNEVHTVEGPRGSFTPSGSYFVSAKMSFIALNVLDVGRFIPGKQKGD